MRASFSSLLVLASLATLAGAPGCRSTEEKPAVDVPTDPAVTPIARLEQERAAAAAFSVFTTDPDAAVRARAALALGRLEHRSAVSWLVRLLTDGDAGVRTSAAFALGQTDLALDDAAPGHAQTRAQVEAALTGALAGEPDAATRRGIVRALGRVASADGLRALVALAGGAGPDAAEALTALGVSGARRQASLRTDDSLKQAIVRGLASADEAVVEAAAYALFRQKVSVARGALEPALKGNAQARIYVLRSAAVQDADARAALVRHGLKDPDWRVRVEAARAAQAGELAELGAALDDATTRVVGAPPAPAMGHVAREACAALGGIEAMPEKVLPLLSRAIRALAPVRAKERAAVCACAIAKDAIEGDADDVAACAEGADDATAGKFQAQLITARRVSSKEKAVLLSVLLKDDEVKVRMAAAQALASDASTPAAEVAAAQLASERDPAVVSTLLELFVPPEQAALLTDDRAFEVGMRLLTGKRFEEVEPLLALARLVRARSSQTAMALTAKLVEHTHADVRDAALGVAHGDRAPGARARVSETPAAASLPAWALLKTSRGEIRLAFDAQRAPATVASFASLARSGLYDGTPFHRVIADFVAQGGDPRGDGSGGPGYSLACERSDEPFVRGAVGIAHAGMDTGGSQFFLTHSAQPHLDGRYTLFAHVVSGLDVMDALQPDDLLLGVDFLLAAPRR